MKRRWNALVWAGFLLALAAPASYVTLRWVNVTDSVTVRARPEEVLDVIDALNPGGRT